MPKFSFRTRTTGARQFVVQEAFVITPSCPSTRRWLLHPSTTLRAEGSLTGADTTTRFTPHSLKYGSSSLTFRNLPVHSMTISTPMDAKSTLRKSASLEKVTVLPSTSKDLPSGAASTFFPHVPWTESNWHRYAADSALQMSFTCTISRVGSSQAYLKQRRPMRPNPFTAHLTGMVSWRWLGLRFDNGNGGGG